MLDYLPVAVILTAALLALAVWVPRWLTLRTIGHAAPDLTGVPGQSPGPAADGLYYFFSPGCGRCVPLGKALGRSTATCRLVRVDVSHAPELAQRFAVREVPTLVQVHHGRIVRVLVGPQATRAFVRPGAHTPR